MLTRRSKSQARHHQQRLKNICTLPSIFILLLFTLILQFPTTNATNVKWTPNNNGNKEAAQTAPRSQKYWDENNIERPEYGYTDAEIAARNNSNSKGGGIGNLLFIMVFGAIGYSMYLKYTTGDFVPPGWCGDSHRLGHSGGSNSAINSFFSNVMNKMKGGEEVRAEEARKARLARFEKLEQETQRRQSSSSFGLGDGDDGRNGDGKTDIAMKKGE